MRGSNSLRQRRVWTVSELLRAVSQLLDQGFSGLRVEGEVSNVSRSARGHLYFTLKDDDAAIDCVLFSSRASRVPFTVEHGLAVVATGSLTIYAQRGRFQMVVETLLPHGQGALQLAFEQLKKRLDAEGLFAAERKRPLPDLPQRIGLVTSLAGAALQDLLQVLTRCPYLAVVVANAAVQGEGAAGELARAIRRLGRSGLVDLVIVARGGGSLEDLQAFNQEVVARAIAACAVPVISGVGHEVDFTIADFVADLRATTPTQAAEMVVARLEAQERRLRDAEARLLRDLRRHLQLARTTLAGLEGSRGLARVPQRLALLRSRLARADRLPPLLLRQVRLAHQRLAAATAVLRRFPGQVRAGGHQRLLARLQRQLEQLLQARLRRLAAAVAGHERSLRHLSPQQVLERGYSITRREGRPGSLRDPAAAPGGTVLVTTLAGGTVRSVVEGFPRRRRQRQEQPPQQASLFAGDGGEEPR